MNQILKRQTSRFHYGSKVPAVTEKRNCNFSCCVIFSFLCSILLAIVCFFSFFSLIVLSVLLIITLWYLQTFFVITILHYTNDPNFTLPVTSMIPILHYINDTNFTLHQWSQFYITSMIPILHYINDSNFTLHQWSQFYITSMIPILHYINDPNFTLHQWSQFYITSMIPILHYIIDPNFTLHQWTQFYITSMIPILHYINDPNCTLHQWSQFYITSMILISSNNVSFYIRSKWTLRLPLCLTSLAVISWWSALLAGKNHSNHWRLQGTSHNRCKFSHHTNNPSNMQIKWKKKNNTTFSEQFQN